MWHTHAAMGASATWLLVPFLSKDDSGVMATVMAFCVIGAMIPDIDALQSKVKHLKVLGIKPIVPVSRAINREFGHRGLLHSLWGWVGWTLFILPLGLATGWLFIVAFAIGYASHLVSDVCTRTGIPFFYPERKNCYLLPPKFRVVTNSVYEELFFAAFALLSFCLLMARLIAFSY